MAIKGTRAVDGEMSVDEFKEWLKRFDKDGDGCISKDELRAAVRSAGKRFSRWRSRRGFRQADTDGNGVLDDSEMDNLVSFARKTLGMKVSMY